MPTRSRVRWAAWTEVERALVTSSGGTDAEDGSTSVVVIGPAADVVTVRVCGEVTHEVAHRAAQAFEKVLTASDQVVALLVVVDMTAVTFLSLEGAVAVVTLARRCGEEGRNLRVQPSPAVRRKLSLTGLDTVVPVGE